MYYHPKISLTGSENFSRPLYEILEQDFNIIVKTSREEINADAANALLASKLEIDEGEPVLVRANP